MVPNEKYFSPLFLNLFCLFRLFCLCVCSLVRAKHLEKLFKTVRVDGIDLVQTSSNFEPSSRFFGRLNVFHFLGFWFIVKDMDPGAAARAAASAATVCTYY